MYVYVFYQPMDMFASIQIAHFNSLWILPRLGLGNFSSGWHGCQGERDHLRSWPVSTAQGVETAEVLGGVAVCVQARHGRHLQQCVLVHRVRGHHQRRLRLCAYTGGGRKGAGEMDMINISIMHSHCMYYGDALRWRGQLALVDG